LALISLENPQNDHPEPLLSLLQPQHSAWQLKWDRWISERQDSEVFLLLEMFVFVQSLELNEVIL